MVSYKRKLRSKILTLHHLCSYTFISLYLDGHLCSVVCIFLYLIYFVTGPPLHGSVITGAWSVHESAAKLGRVSTYEGKKSKWLLEF